MALFEGKSKAERNKIIAAIALGVVAVFSVGYLLLGSSSSSPKPKPRATPSPTPLANGKPGPGGSVVGVVEYVPQRIEINFAVPPAGDVGRNIFAFIEPTPTPSPVPVNNTPPVPSPSPPSMLIASLSPQTVYAGTSDFELSVSGDRFVPGVQIFVNENQIPTRFNNAQYLTAKIPAPMIANEGGPRIVVKSLDGKLFSNTATLVVQAAPMPNYNYIGILETRQRIGTAILEDKNTKAQVSAQRGDVVGGRFRVTSMSEREVVLTDTTLHIRHPIPMTSDAGKNNPIQGRPRQQGDDDDGNP